MITLCELKGVGPATATLLCSIYKNNIPFMSDEGLKGLGLKL